MEHRMGDLEEINFKSVLLTCKGNTKVDGQFRALERITFNIHCHSSLGPCLVFAVLWVAVTFWSSGEGRSAS
jgi:hypothetical protein